MRLCIFLLPFVYDCSLQNALYPQSAAIFHKTKIPVKCCNSGTHQSIILRLTMLLTTLPLSCIFLLSYFLIFQSLIIIFNSAKQKQIFFLPLLFCDRDEVIPFFYISSSDFFLYLLFDFVELVSIFSFSLFQGKQSSLLSCNYSSLYFMIILLYP